MRLLLSMFIMFLYTASVQAQNVADIRLLYKDATKSQEQAEAFYKPLEGVSKSDKPVLVAYKGSGLALLARYEKLTARAPKIKEAVQWIEQAVAKEPENAEIRLIRLSVQEHLPKFLKYNDDIEADKQFLQDALPNIKDEGLRMMIDGYFSEFSKTN